MQTIVKRYRPFRLFSATALLGALAIGGLRATEARSQAIGAPVSGFSSTASATASSLEPPPSSVGFFPLTSVHKGLTGTAWTVFEGTKPEPMDVEILGILHGARGPGRDLILARLHGSKPEYTGVVAGMSGSPVYIDGRLAGALSYRIGQFSKEPIAGITPIEQMMEVRDLSVAGDTESPHLTAGNTPVPQPEQTGGPHTFPTPWKDATPSIAPTDPGTTFAAMETPLLMSGFEPQAISLWKQQMTGTGLEMISAGGGVGGASGESAPDFGPIVPGSAVSLELVRGDLEIAATCTVTYVDPRQLLACGHPVMQAGPVSLPMTSTEVVATLASPLNAFKIVNTGRTIGAFTEDRDAAIAGVLGGAARMIPVDISVDQQKSIDQQKSLDQPKSTDQQAAKRVQRKIEVVDLPSLTPSAVLVSVYQTLLQTNQSSARNSYHVTGEITVHGRPPVPVDAWGTPGESMAAQLAAALGVGDAFNRLYMNETRQEPMESVRLHVDVLPEDRRVDLESVRLVSSSIVHAGDTVVVEATLRPWEQPARNLRIPFTLPARLQPGTLRLMVGSAASLDRTLDASRPQSHPAGETAAAARLRGLHSADRLYVTLLLPESQASVEGRTLDSLPLSMANTLESERGSADIGLNGESVAVTADAPAGGVLTGQQLLTLHVEVGGGLH